MVRRIVAMSSEIPHRRDMPSGRSWLLRAGAMIAPRPDDAMPFGQLAYSCAPSPAGGNTKTESTHHHSSAPLRPLEERTGRRTWRASVRRRP